MDIYSYIKTEENRYNNIPIPIVENYEWSMARHVKLTTLYLNSKYETGNQDMKPFRNIVLPAINLQHRAVEFAVKDIDFFIDDAEQHYKSFLVRKFHEVWARKYNLANYLDNLTETYTDYGGVLTKKIKNSVPIVIPFQQLAFCDQTDVMSGPICEKHQYTPDRLMEMKSQGWGEASNGATATLEEVISLALNQKTTTQVNGKIIDTPSKYIEVYELHGVLPAKYLYDPEDPNIDVQESDYVRQMQIICFYKDANNNDQGITLFKGKEKKDGVYKFFKRDEIFGRALGRGGVEELFEQQVWTNYSEIQKKEILDQAKVFYQTSDTEFQNRNATNVANAENGQLFYHADGKPVSQMNTFPTNLQPFENAINAWISNAKEISASYDTISGADTKGGMPFRLGALLNQEAHSLHKYRKGKIGGIFLPELYRDWILPEMVKEMSNEQEFSAMVSLEEMNQIVDNVVTYAVNEQIKKKILNAKPGKPAIAPGEIPALQQAYKEMFFKGKNQKFFKLFQNEVKDIPIDMMVNVTGEEKDKQEMIDKLSSIFTSLVPILGANPQFFEQNPKMAKLFSDIIEYSGLDPLDYTMMAPPVQSASQNSSIPSPVNVKSTAPEPKATPTLSQ